MVCPHLVSRAYTLSGTLWAHRWSTQVVLLVSVISRSVRPEDSWGYAMHARQDMTSLILVAHSARWRVVMGVVVVVPLLNFNLRAAQPTEVKMVLPAPNRRQVMGQYLLCASLAQP